MAAIASTQDATSSLAIAVDSDIGLSASDLEQRFALYKQMGVSTLLFDFGWRQIQTSASDTNYSIPAPLLQFMQLAQAAGFKFEITLGTEDSPPSWFFAEHPDAKIVNQQGDYSTNMVSYWYPGIYSLMQQETDYVFQTLAKNNLLDNVAYIRVPFGPAGEALYPAAWTMGYASDSDTTFWFYGADAQANFVSSMETKYGTIAAADAAWGTAFSSWSQVAIPAAGTHPGTMWNDVLTWYKDSKDSFVAWQIQDYEAEVAKYEPNNPPQLILLAGGTHVTPSDWSQAVASGGGDLAIKIMSDTDFLLNEAAQNHLTVAYTGMPNDTELAWIRSYMQANNINVPLFGENVGGIGASRVNLDDMLYDIAAYKLSGFDWVNESAILNSDGTPNANYSAVSSLITSIAAELSGSNSFSGGLAAIPAVNTVSSPILDPFTLQAGQSISYGDLSLIMQTDGNLVLYKNLTPSTQTALWASGTSGLGSASSEAVFQGDGNLVLYQGQQQDAAHAYWSSGTSGHANDHVVLSDTAPYVSITSGSSAIWSGHSIN